MILLLFSLLVVALAACLVGRLIYLLLEIRGNRRRGKLAAQSSQRRRRKILVVLGSGGHTTEMLPLISSLITGATQSPHSPLFDPVVFVKADTDTTSIDRLQHCYPAACTVPVYNIPRAREVGQSYFTSIGSTLYALYYAYQIIVQERPDLILVNGPGTCVPICLAGFVHLRFWPLKAPAQQHHLIVVESFCRVQSLALTTRVLRPFADLLLVHWNELHQKYPHDTKLLSSIIMDH
jgi:beta-1,4-N-acetylglucosaminyltransferase